MLSLALYDEKEFQRYYQRKSSDTFLTDQSWDYKVS